MSKERERAVWIGGSRPMLRGLSKRSGGPSNEATTTSEQGFPETTLVA